MRSARIGILYPFCNLRIYGGGLNKWLEAAGCNRAHDLNSNELKSKLQFLIKMHKLHQDVKAQIFGRRH